MKAIATDNAGAATTSTAAAITVGSVTNVAPTVSLTSPTSGASFAAPATIALTATAADADGTIAKVDFYNGPLCSAAIPRAPTPTRGPASALAATP